MVKDFITVLSLVVRQTMGRFTPALANEVSTVVLPASAAVILPCMAMVAAAAVVLALLAKPPKMPVARMPPLPKYLVRRVPPISMEMNTIPNQRTFVSEIGEVSVSVPGTLSSILRSRHTQKPATRVMARSGTRVALSDRGEKIVARIRFLANMAIVVNRHRVVVRETNPVARRRVPSSATVAL